MKSILFYILSLLSFLDVSSQITNDNSFTGKVYTFSTPTNVRYMTVKLSDVGTYTNFNFFDSKFHNYFSSWTSRTVVESVYFCSDKLFNSDTLFEFIVVFKGAYNQYTSYLYNEKMKELMSFGSDHFFSLVKIMGSFKLLAGTESTDDIYSLPGSIPLDKGDKGDPGVKGDKGDIGPKGDKGDKGDPGMSYTATKSIIGNSYLLSDPTPNPTIDNTTIGYDLGMINTGSSYLVFYDLKGVKRLSVLMDSNQDHIDVTKSILGTGTFIYRIENDNNISAGKKLIIE